MPSTEHILGGSSDYSSSWKPQTTLGFSLFNSPSSSTIKSLVYPEIQESIQSHFVGRGRKKGKLTKDM